MSIGAYRSRVRIRRPGETRAALGETVATYAEVGYAWAEMAIPERRLRSYGAGELPQGSVGMETHAGAPVQTRDILQITAGPEAGTAWTVESIHRPGNGRAVAVLAIYNEAVPEPGP